MDEQSPKYKLNLSDGKRILVGAGVACGGALLVYVTDLLPQVDFGVYTPIAVALGGVLVNAARKFLAGVK